jgi:hypothetical protein
LIDIGSTIALVRTGSQSERYESGGPDMKISACPAIAIVLVFGAVVGQSPQSNAATTTEWAWMTVRVPGSTTPTYPDAMDQGSTGSPAYFTSGGTGNYGIVLPGVTAPAGVVQLAVLATDNVYCEAASTGVVVGANKTDFELGCGHDSTHNADARFIVSYLTSDVTGLTGAALAYAKVQPDRPDGKYLEVSENSMGGTNHFVRNGSGDYTIQLGKMGTFHGAILLSPDWVGTACWVTGQTKTSTGALAIGVRCNHGDGFDRFALTFLSRIGLKGPGGHNVAYVFADKPTEASYTPATVTSWSSAGATPSPRISRLGVGRYQVRLPHMPDGGAAIVTAMANSARRCTVSGIQLTGAPPQLINVRCSKTGGTNTDTRFFLSYEGPG